MARINIEDDFWLDIGAVAAAMGDYAKAVGTVLLFIRHSQEKHKKGQMISEHEFAEKFHESLVPNFAKRTPSGIQAKGAEKHFAWLEQKIEAGRAGGKKSAAKRPRNAKGQLLQIKNTPSDHQPSSSSSNSNSNSPSSLVAPAPQSPDENLVKVYCDLWKQRNGKSPDITGKDAGQLKRLAKELGFRRSSELVRSYFLMPDPFFLKRGYDVSTLILNKTAIAQFETSGKIVTSELVKQVEKKIDKLQNTRQRKSLDEMQAEREAMLADANVVPLLGRGEK